MLCLFQEEVNTVCPIQQAILTMDMEMDKVTHSIICWGPCADTNRKLLRPACRKAGAPTPRGSRRQSLMAAFPNMKIVRYGENCI